MRTGGTPDDSEGGTASLVLAAARRSFAERGYVGTTVRGIARELDVDPGLVRYYFGSKDELFDRCLEAPEGFVDGARAACTSPIASRGQTIVRYLLDSWDDEITGAHLRALYLSASHEPRALERVSGFFSDSLRQAIVDGLDDTSLTEVEKDERAALMTTELIGLATARYLWHLEPTASMPTDRLVELVGSVLNRHLWAG